MESGSKVILIAAEDLISKNISTDPLTFHFLYRITQDISGSIGKQQHPHCFFNV